MTVPNGPHAGEAAALRFTIITSEIPDRLTKRYDLAHDGSLIKSPAGNLTRGAFRRATATGLEDLARQLDALHPNQAVTWGLPDDESGEVVARGISDDHPGAITRTDDWFTFPDGPGVMMLDHDGTEGNLPPLTAEALYTLLIVACPALADAPMLVRPSSSSGIVAEDGRPLLPLSKWRIYLPVTRACDIPAAGSRLVCLLQASGHAWTHTTSAGTVLPRTLLDASVWSPRGLDFAARAVLGPGLSRLECPPQFFGDTFALFDLARVTVDATQHTRAAVAIAQARARADAPAREIRERWLGERAARIARDTGIDGADARARLAQAVDSGELPPGFPLRLDDGTETTVDQLLQDAALQKRRMCDPIEPDRDDGDSRIASVVRPFGVPHLHSHAHGGQMWRLLADPARVFAAAPVSEPLPPPSVPGSLRNATTGEPMCRFTIRSDDPLQSARGILEREFEHTDADRLKHWQGVFYRWTGATWRAMTDDDTNAMLYAALDRHAPVMYRPTRESVGKLAHALKAAAHLDSVLAPPCWIADRAGPAPRELIACRNGLLHLPSRSLLPSSPAFFSMNAVPYDYRPDALPPAQWLKFLHDLWPDEPDAIDALQEVFGYLLTPDTRQQKAFLLIGPKRAGKGTIGRVLSALLGADNVTSPSLSSLGSEFGLQPLIGKLAAVVSDARLGGRADPKSVAENLLRITGEDLVDVNRKFLAPVSLRLWARFVLMTNELPRLADASGAMASRFVILKLERSFYGVEDHGLSDRLQAELPGVLNWAIEGWQRLQARGHFVQPRSAADDVEALADLGSPISAFLREVCDVSPVAEVAVDRLYQLWTLWCGEQGVDRKTTKQVFGADLRAALPGIKDTQPRTPTGDRYRAYRGVGVKPGTRWHAWPTIARTVGHTAAPIP
jgi:putative DNA primase/helicase